MNMIKLSNYIYRIFLVLIFMLLVPGKMGGLAFAALTDISSAPIFTEVTATTEVKPNVMFILDDSGSMDFDYMPDNAQDFQPSSSFFSGTTYRVGGASSQCNGVYYNPTITYTAPIKADGTSYTNSSFTAAWKDGYNTGNGTTNLSTSFKASSSDAAQAAYYWTYSGTETTEKLKDYYNTNSTFYKECRSTLTGGTSGVITSGQPGQGKFTRVIVSSTSGPGGTDERTNFANWYSYYRTRMLTMKTAAGHAFSSIDDHFRVGFMSINNNDSPAFLNITDFDSTQKTNWYTKLYDSDPGDSTPLRSALSNAGLIYAGKKTSLYGQTVVDPVQYSCQQNYTILSTDGFWNGSGGKKLDNSTMDSPDSALPRPYGDGGYSQPQTRTSQLQQRTVSTQAQQRTSQLQQRTSQLQKQESQLQKRTKSHGNWGSWQNVSSCNASSSVQCQYSDGSWTPTSTCNAIAKDTRDPYSVGLARSCRTVSGSYSNVASCTETSPDASGNFIECQYNAGSWTNVASCTAIAKSAGPAYTVASAVECQDVVTNGTWANATSCTETAGPPANTTGSATECQYTAFSAWSNVNSCTATSQSTGPTYTVGVANECQTVGLGGTPNTLADVAAYYYYTNLRTTDLDNCTGPVIPPATTATDLCAANKVPPSGIDTATWQHMTTFTLGLGARGKMVFSSTYLTDKTGDYYSVSKGTTASSSECTWQSTGTTCNWPVPDDDQIQNIDDLWHAAVNGHGNYYSAADPTGLANGLASSLNVIINTPKPGTAAAAATTNPQITNDQDNYQFSTYFKSIEWSGELIRQLIDPATGSVADYNHMNPDPSTYDWSAQALLDAKTYTTRKIYTKGTISGVTGMIDFTWTNIDSANLESYFTAPHISTSPPSGLTGLSQFCSTGTDCLSSTAQSNSTVSNGGAAGEALVNFLRGDISNEEGSTTDPTKFYRHRTHVLGDIVSAQPQYVGPPNKSYIDTGYSDFKDQKASRTPMVYAAANDGMLHAFNAGTGQEEWAYIPSFVLSKLYTLADKEYSDKHQYFVEGTPVVSDVYYDGSWKTILVGGLNAGGKGYYALDITDPAAPALLWEFTDTNMGYTYGNPQIVKLDNATGTSFGTWVVLLTSGYNNVGDGKGWLYVVSPKTGAILNSVSTTAGSTSSPSGLAKIVAQAGSDNIVKRVYGGDLLGNLWRFNVGASTSTVQLVATLKDASGNAQSITTKPQVTTYSGLPLVFVGTGRYLGESDVPSTQTQTFYALKDKLDGTSYDNPRELDGFFTQTLSEGTCPADASVDVCEPGTEIREMTVGEGSLLDKDGWYVDFPDGELSATDSKLTQGTISFTTGLPTESTSAVCGEGDATSGDPATFDYQLDYLTGAVIGASVGEKGVAGVYLGVGLATAPQVVQLEDGTLVEIIRLSTGETVTRKLRVGSSSGTVSRESWRELISE